MNARTCPRTGARHRTLRGSRGSSRRPLRSIAARWLLAAAWLVGAAACATGPDARRGRLSELPSRSAPTVETPRAAGSPRAPGPPTLVAPDASAPAAAHRTACPDAPAATSPGTSGPAASATPSGGPSPPLGLPLDRDRVALGSGRATLAVALPPNRYVSLGVMGPADALLSLELRASTGPVELGTHTTLDDDGRLPAFLSFATPHEPSEVLLVLETRAPVEVRRASVDPTEIAAPSRRDLKLGRAMARPLIGLPAPSGPQDGYLLESPERYLFVRIDIAVALRQALAQTRIRFRRNPVALGDASQWDGEPPGTDRGKSRHIGHRDGTEIDVGLPSDDDSPSTIQRRCQGVLVERDELVCAPGTVRHVDARRLAYFLGLLLDGPTPHGIYMPEGRPGPTAPLHSILTDQAYVDEIRKAAEWLRRRRWIHDEGYGALVEEGLLRPSPWHTDHVHLRFAGEPAAVLTP